MEYSNPKPYDEEHKENKYDYGKMGYMPNYPMQNYQMQGYPMQTCPMYGNPMYCPMFKNQMQYPSMPWPTRDDFDEPDEYSEEDDYLDSETRQYGYGRPRPGYHYYPRPYYPRPYYPRPYYPYSYYYPRPNPLLFLLPFFF